MVTRLWFVYIILNFHADYTLQDDLGLYLSQFQPQIMLQRIVTVED